MTLEIIKGDITQVSVDVIVNAANSSLMGGGGVDGAIHRAGCMKIRAKQGGCKTGEAVITSAGKLPAKYVIHTVGPVYNNGGDKKRIQLANCYHNSLKLMVEYGLKTIAFPNISTGIYKFPKELAAKIAIKTVRSFKQEQIEEVIFVCYDKENYMLYDKLLRI